MLEHRTRRVIPLPRVVSPHDALSLYEGDPYVALLESQGAASKQARYSFLCADPFLVFRSKRAECFLGPPDDLRRVVGDAFAELASLMRQRREDERARTPDEPPFLGGAVGYFGYELLHLIESVPDRGRDEQLPDAYFAFYRTIVANDRLAKRSWLVVNGIGASSGQAEADAEARSVSTLRKLEMLRPGPRVDTTAIRARRAEILASRRLSDEHLEAANVRPVVKHGEYLKLVEAAREHIIAGDVFEICLTQRFDTELTGSGESLFRMLRTVNEAPFASYLRFPELEVISSSPERFLRADHDRWVESRPMKGTRPRGATPALDAALLHELASSEKDQAENIMIVDLARNDLGKVCELGTVVVPELRVIETYPFTHQLVSTVVGRLREDIHAVDLIKAAFPPGSMTGAPKVEAMRIIERLESGPRGVFSGAIGYLDFDGSLDLGVAIRTFVKTGESLSFHVGGAIVADSDPEDEYRETLDKAHGLVTALELVQSREAR